jgi:hypothetical protein
MIENVEAGVRRRREDQARREHFHESLVVFEPCGATVQDRYRAAAVLLHSGA